MAFLYYPSKFEKIIESVMDEINYELYQHRKEEKRRFYIGQNPFFDEDGLTIVRKCVFTETEKEEPWQDSEFATYFRNISDDDVYVVGEKNEKISGCLITQMINNPRLYEEQLMIGNDATRLNILNRNNKKVFASELFDPLKKLIPKQILDLENKEIPLKRNEEHIKGIIKDICKISLDYALENGEIHIM